MSFFTVPNSFTFLDSTRSYSRIGVDPGVAIAIMGGGGFVNFGDHAHFELTLLASGEEGTFTPYGGLRAMQVMPISQGAVRECITRSWPAA